MSHEAAIKPVPDTHGWHLGYCCECDCGWMSDLHDRQSQALMDFQTHLKTTTENI